MSANPSARRNYCQEFLDKEPIYNALRARLDEMNDAHDWAGAAEIEEAIANLHSEDALRGSLLGSLGPLDDRQKVLSELREILSAYGRHLLRDGLIASAEPREQSRESELLAEWAARPQLFAQFLQWLCSHSNVLHRAVAFSPPLVLVAASMDSGVSSNEAVA